MNLITECFLAVARATIIATLAVWAGRAICPLLTRRWVWPLLLAPYLPPALLVGYGYYLFAQQLPPLAKDAFYVLLVWLKLTPIAALALYFAPSAMSGEAVHCWRMMGRALERAPTIRSRVSFWLRGEGRAPCVAFASVFLFAFGEFEIASRLQIKTWTVTLFDAHVGGLLLSESLRLVLLPMMIQTALLITVGALFWRSHVGAARSNLTSSPTTLGWICLGAAMVIIVIIPVGFTVRGATLGFVELMRRFELSKELLASLAFGIGTAVCAFSVAMCSLQNLWSAGACSRFRWGSLLPPCDQSPQPKQASAAQSGSKLPQSITAVRATTLALSTIGLLGGLVVALLAQATFRATPLYDTPVPLLVALTLLTLPFAVLLLALLKTFEPRAAIFVAQLADRREIVWRLRTSEQFWVLFLLFCWGYFELTASAILHPSAMTPAWVRLYNLMHYGQSWLLSAMVLVAFALPFVVLGLARGTCSVIWRSKQNEPSRSDNTIAPMGLR